jgi:hypothetical protein
MVDFKLAPKLSHPQARWVLAFDVSCGKCRKISRAVADACHGTLEILPLTHHDVWRWRQQALGGQAVWAPTLIKVQANNIRAWTGMRMGIALMCHLGPQSTMRVLAAVGREWSSRNEGMFDPIDKKVGSILQIGIGLRAMAGSLGMGRSFRTGALGVDPRSWSEVNEGLLSLSYNELVKYPTPYRNAILGRLPLEMQSQLWIEHLNRYRMAHPDLLQDQIEVIDCAVALIPSVFDDQQDRPDDLERLDEAAKRAFGDKSRAVIATFGPADSELSGLTCDCAREIDWCGSNMHCGPADCTTASHCGTFLRYTCNGRCEPRAVLPRPTPVWADGSVMH